MERFILSQLIAWKDSKKRKPLVLRGARQTGKTWIMKEFGRLHFENFVCFNFDENEELKQLFETTKDVGRLIEQLSLIADAPIKPQSTLIIFDEVQECSHALNSLKYFKENAPEYAVIAAGSLLGILLAKPHSYPVGQVNFLDLAPLSFDEFLLATNESLYKFFITITKDSVINDIFHNRLMEAYRIYLTIGGLPEAVQSWIDDKNPQEVARIHSEVVSLYEYDFGKHNGKVNAGRILMIFRNLVSQLSKENRKFIYGVVKTGARAREFEEAVEWLVSAGMVNRVYCSSNNEYSLVTFDDLSAFKLYLLDTGLLKHMARLTNESVILDADFQFKGALAENYVVQQLLGQFETSPRYFPFGKHEVDFLIQVGMRVIPIEVKSSKNIASPSSKAYKEKYNPPLYIRFSALNLKHDGTTLNIPFYLAGKTKDLIYLSP
ncbi:MAG: AAA family ATPase [Firmicutes bacterium]|nr:AAA family ATPase [Bacillota bacterium]